ncbi:MAG: hypothetical protein AAB225_01110 [Acidobacteriota bacterium]
MRRKTVPALDQVVPKEILDHAPRVIEIGQPKKPTKCVVCGAECSPTSPEQLCWVCRRLKISAWRESETQMPAQE